MKGHVGAKALRRKGGGARFFKNFLKAAPTLAKQAEKPLA